MTASMITPFYSTESNNASHSQKGALSKFYTVHFYAFDGDFFENEVEASNESEAYDLALELANGLPEAIDYICIYAQD